jgi:hypothetical protein
MITTHMEAQTAMFSVEPGFINWRTATLSLGIRYVLVNYGQKEGKSWIYQSAILWDSRDILDYCLRLQESPAIKIIDISILEHIGRGKNYTCRLTRVVEIRLYKEDFVEHPVYVTDTGEAVGLMQGWEKQKMKSIYKAKRIGPKT